MVWTWNNIVNTPQRILAGYLRRRGWVVFYLEPHQRHCSATCWLQLYNETEKR